MVHKYFELIKTPLTGPWRWFDETMLDCCEPLDKVKAKGISFGKVICLGHCAGAKVESFRTNQSSIDEFRKYVMTCSMSEDCHIIASYNRRAFKQVDYNCLFLSFSFWLTVPNITICTKSYL